MNAVSRLTVPTLVGTIALAMAAPTASALPPGCDWSTDAGVQACMGGGPFDAGKNGNGDTYDPPGRVPASRGMPTITNPQGVRTVIMADVYALICNDLDVNGVSIPSVERIHNVLINDPDYEYEAYDAGQIVALAVESTCPEYKGPLMRATNEALYG